MAEVPPTMKEHAQVQQALQHLRVLDLSRILAGPWCTQMLADLGADVIKVEHPTRGDDTRHLGPPWMTDTAGKAGRDASYYASTNRSKRSVCINIASAAGSDLVRELAKHCDVLVENYKVGDLARYGLDYASISEVNPRIVYCSITGYGQSGPYASRPGYDFVFQAEGGLMSITGERDDLAGGGPQKTGVPIADITTGLYASTAILAALSYREISGAGQHIDLSLLDCTVALASNQGTSYLVNGIVPRRWGNAHPALVPYQVFDCSDGQVVVAVANDLQWQRFCRAIGAPEMAHHAHYRTASGRIENRAALLAEVQERIRAHTAQHWLHTLERAGIPSGRINDYAQAFAHPQVVHREMAVEVRNEDDEAAVPLIANPIKLSKTPVRYRHAPPPLGRHTRSVLHELLDKSDEEVEALRLAGCIACGAP